MLDNQQVVRRGCNETDNTRKKVVKHGRGHKNTEHGKGKNT